MQVKIPQLLEDYRNQMSNPDLQTKYDISWRKLREILVENGVFRKCNSLRTSDSKIEYIKENYFKESNLDLAKKLNLSEDWIRVLAKREGLPKKGSGWKYNPYIENLDKNSPEFYYFLGWMAADGSISKNFQQVSLKITDKEILDKFMIIFPTAKLYYNPKEVGKDMHHLCICSTTLALYLKDLGITPNKSKTLNVLDDLWNNHFVRGFFEGDGHVRKTFPHNKYKRYSAGFVGASEKFMFKLQTYLEKNGISCKLIQEKNYFRLRIEGKDNLKNFYNHIYNNCENWYLERKKQILDQLFSNE